MKDEKDIQAIVEDQQESGNPELEKQISPEASNDTSSEETHEVDAGDNPTAEDAPALEAEADGSLQETEKSSHGDENSENEEPVSEEESSEEKSKEEDPSTPKEQAKQAEESDGQGEQFGTIPPQKLQAILEALIFTSSKPVALSSLEDTLGSLSRKDIKQGLKELATNLEESQRGIRLKELAGGYIIVTDTELADYVRQFQRSKPRRLSRAAMETLAVVAYQQPAVRAEIDQIRGVDSGGVVKSLLDKKLIKVIGRREDVGRPLEYGTTKQFMTYFGLNSLRDMPTLQEFEELAAESKAKYESETGEKLEDSEEKEKLWQGAMDQSHLVGANEELDKVAEELVETVHEVKQVEEEVMGRVPDSDEEPIDDEPLIDRDAAEIGQVNNMPKTEQQVTQPEKKQEGTDNSEN